MNPKLEYKEEQRKRNSFYASDSCKLGIDITLELQDTPKTNPTLWNNTLRMAAGKGVELQMIDILKQNNIIDKDYDQEKIPTTSIIRNGIEIRMRFDAIIKKGGAILKGEDSRLPNNVEIKLEEGEVLEIKSINNKNSFDIQDYINNNPRESYVMQLSMYMDALEKERGHLFVSAIDGLNYFWFVCNRLHDRVYQCGNVVVDLDKEYARFAEIWANKDKEPNWFEETYKLDLEKIDWTKLSAGNISKARNNALVIGSEGKFKIDYSPYKDLIIQKQGATKGYTNEELAVIAVKTKNYTTWNKTK